MSIIELIFGHGNKLEKILSELKKVEAEQVEQALTLDRLDRNMAQFILDVDQLSNATSRCCTKILEQLDKIEAAVIVKRHLVSGNPSFGTPRKSNRRT